MPKKHEIKVKFEIGLKSFFNLDNDLNGKFVWISWKRGGKSENKGETKRVLVSSCMAVFGQTISLASTLFQDDKTKKFESKKLELVFKEVIHICLINQHWIVHLNIAIFKMCPFLLSYNCRKDDRLTLLLFKQEYKKKAKLLGKIGVELADYGKQGEYKGVTIPLKSKKKAKDTSKAPSLKVT